MSYNYRDQPYSVWKQSYARFPKEIQGVRCQDFQSVETADGRVFTGYYTNGVLNGVAKVEFPNGNVLVGEFKKGALHGRVKMIYPGGNSEERNFIGLLSGHASRRTLNEGKLFSYSGSLVNIDIPPIIKFSEWINLQN